MEADDVLVRPAEYQPTLADAHLDSRPQRSTPGQEADASSEQLAVRPESVVQAAAADKANCATDDSYHGRCVRQAVTPYRAASTAFWARALTFV